MAEVIQAAIAVAVMAVPISAYARARYWARRAEEACKESQLASYRAHDSAGEAEEALRTIVNTNTEGGQR